MADNKQDPQDPSGGGWTYSPKGDQQPAPTPPAADLEEALAPDKSPSSQEDSVSWTASEFIAHHKGVGWYMMLALVGLALSAVVYLLTSDMITVFVIMLCFLVFGIAAGRKPRILAYRLDHSGLTIGQRNYPYVNYKSFAVVDEDNFASIVLLPLKRFSPSISIYFAPEDEDHILHTLSQYLPVEQGKLDLFESLMRRIRF